MYPYLFENETDLHPIPIHFLFCSSVNYLYKDFTGMAHQTEYMIYLHLLARDLFGIGMNMFFWKSEGTAI